MLTVNRVIFFAEIPSICRWAEDNKVIPRLQLFFAETMQTLIKKLESKINVRYLDDGNLAKDYKIELRNLKKILKPENIMV